MADESVVHRRPVQGPATHVIAIGVGAYDHLIGGAGASSAHGEGMGQLTSAPVSLVAFTDWVIQHFHHRDKPLASVRLVASGLAQGRYRNPIDNQDIDIPAATLQNVKQAVREWKAAGDSDEGNLLLFYFVGHGIARGSAQSLLVKDFGSDDNAPLDGAIDFMQMRVGMQRCQARQQVYFIDACRAISDQLLGGGFAGDSIITPGLQGYRGPLACEAPVYFATLLGDEAYGRPGEPSIFTDALLRSFRGAGSDDAEGDWRVRTTNLTTALDFFARRAREQGLDILQKPSSTDASAFFIHYLADKPTIPVVLKCDPEAAHAHVVFAYADEAGNVKNHGTGPLDLELPEGQYQFSWSFPAAPQNAGYKASSLKRYVHPPYYSPAPLRVLL